IWRRANSQGLRRARNAGCSGSTCRTGGSCPEWRTDLAAVGCLVFRFCQSLSLSVWSASGLPGRRAADSSLARSFGLSVSFFQFRFSAFWFLEWATNWTDWTADRLTDQQAKRLTIDRLNDRQTNRLTQGSPHGLSIPIRMLHLLRHHLFNVRDDFVNVHVTGVNGHGIGGRRQRGDRTLAVPEV